MVDGDNKMLLKNFVVTHNSYFTAQKIIYKMVTEKGHRFLVARKVKKEVKHSCYDLLVQTIRNFEMTDLFSFNNTEASIKCKVTDNAIFSVGLDDVTKLNMALLFLHIVRMFLRPYLSHSIWYLLLTEYCFLSIVCQ